jgi:hypothetical protein
MQTLKVSVPGVTDELLNVYLFNVLDEFFRRTNAWQFRDEIELIENTYEYPFDVPGNTQVVRLLGVEHNNVPIAPTASIGAVQKALGTIEPEMVFPDGDTQVHYTQSDIDSTTNIFSYAIYRPNYITITGLPDAEARRTPMRTVAAITLASSCLECADCGEWSVEDWMWDMFFDAWLNGMQSRLYGMPAKPWTNATLATYHGKRFRNKLAYHKQEAMRGFTYNTPTWRFPRGW